MKIANIEKQLIDNVLTTDIGGLSLIYNELFEQMIAEKYTLRKIKNKLISSSSIIFYRLCDSCPLRDSFYHNHHNFLDEIETVETLEDVRALGFKMIKNSVSILLSTTCHTQHWMVLRSMEFIRKNLQSDLSLETIAAHVGANPNYLSTIFKKELNMNYSDYVNSIKVEKCKQLLRQSDFAHIDIAVECGFHSESYFCSVFKKFTGFTPRAYRTLPLESITGTSINETKVNTAVI